MKDDRSEFIATLPKGGVGAEIGVWEGDFSQQALNGCSPRKLYLVDPWERNDDATNYTSTVTRSQSEIDEVHDGVAARFADDDRVEIVRRRSNDAVNDLRAVRFDWVYIDGVHTYEAVTQDLALWWENIKTAGTLSGHDFDKQGVRLAVLEFAIRQQVQVNTIGVNYAMQKPTG